MKHRSKVFTFMEMLSALMEQPRLPTKLAQMCNLNYVRLAEYTGPLLEKGFIRKDIVDGHEVFRITGDGIEIHKEWSGIYAKIFDLM